MSGAGRPPPLRGPRRRPLLRMALMGSICPRRVLCSWTCLSEEGVTRDLIRPQYCPAGTTWGLERHQEKEAEGWSVPVWPHQNRRGAPFSLGQGSHSPQDRVLGTSGWRGAPGACMLPVTPRLPSRGSGTRRFAWLVNKAGVLAQFLGACLLETAASLRETRVGMCVELSAY